MAEDEALIQIKTTTLSLARRFRTTPPAQKIDDIFVIIIDQWDNRDMATSDNKSRLLKTSIFLEGDQVFVQMEHSPPC